MRVCVVGAGLAGSLLAWRLVQRPGVRVMLVGDEHRHAASAASGGLVRGYEPDEYNAALAVRGLAVLYASPTLRSWAAFREIGSVYLTAARPARRTLDAIDAALPGSLSLAPGDAAARHGLAGVPPGHTAVVERRAGFINPARLAARARREVILRGGVVRAGTVARIRREAGEWVEHADAVVLAAGAWTPGLLAGNGLPAGGLRTKLIRYGVFRAAGPVPRAFVDESTGLYGRPDGLGRMLLGLPTVDWDAPPGTSHRDGVQAGRSAAAEVRRAAARRLPEVTLGRYRAVAAADCYAPDGQLRLRPVAPEVPGLFTFTGGSGGAAKTALAASVDAADALLRSNRQRETDDDLSPVP
jgi:glycine/D-amino acid oxidase-like deaminating enzyme